MRKILFTIALTLIFIYLFPSPTYAHFLATDGTIGAVLHVDPNDEPIAGSQASFFFEFKDKTNRFNPKDCDCIFAISENGKNIFSQPLFENNANPSLSTASVFYTFPKLDVYQVHVTGKPNTPNEFQPFALTWNFRVDQQATQTAATTNHSQTFSRYRIPFILAGVVLISLVCYYLNSLKKGNKQPKKGGEKNSEEKDTGSIY